MRPVESLEAQAAAWGVRLDDGSLELLQRFARLLADYDKANVIGTRDLDLILTDHVLDSLSCFLHEPLRVEGRIADVGSGGGLPGIPISIVRRSFPATLVESTGKKATFLRYATEQLGLRGVVVVNSRVEDIGRIPQYRGANRIVTARAVARLSVVAEYCVPLLEVGGQAIAMKGRLGSEELEEGRRAVNELGAEISEIKPVSYLTGVDVKERNLVVIEKVGETPGRYPRKPGMAAKRPLGAR